MSNLERSQVVDGNWHVLVYDHGLEKLRQTYETLNFNPKNGTLQQLGTFGGHCSGTLNAFAQDNEQLTQKSKFHARQLSIQEPNTPGFMLGLQPEFQELPDFLGKRTGSDPYNLAPRNLSILRPQFDNAAADSPTSTTNSERSEITEASTECNFIGGQQQLVWDQQPRILQPHSMQQSGLNDMQLLKQHIMFKQLQEIQRQQQLQQLDDSRQQNSLNQHSSVANQIAEVQYSPLFNGTPVNDTSPTLMNWNQRSAFPSAQSVSIRAVPSQEQAQALRFMTMDPQQFDESLYGAPVANVRGPINQYSQFRDFSHDSANLLNKFGVRGDQATVSPDKFWLPQGPFISKHGLQETNMFGQVPLQDLNSATMLGDSHPGHAQENVLLQEPNGKHESPGWSAVQQKTMQHGSSQDGLVSLDPIEEKILYNMDNDIWNASFSMSGDMDAKGVSNVLKHTEHSRAFPSTQSGSWSALMQSAVAEASSGDTGLQEEWSGLTFQNTELSPDNQPSFILDNEKQQGVWSDKSVQGAPSLGSKSFPLLNDSSVNSSISRTGEFMSKQGEDIHDDESIQKVSKNTSNWWDTNPQNNLPLERSQPAQTFIQLDHTWASQINEQGVNVTLQQLKASPNVVRQPSSKPEGPTTEAFCKRGDYDSLPWKIANEPELSSFSRSAGGMEQVFSDTEHSLLNSENRKMSDFAIVPNSCTSKAHWVIDQQASDINQFPSSKQNQLRSSSQVRQSSYGMTGQTYEQQQKCYQPENSKRLSSQDLEHLQQLNFHVDGSNANISLVKGSVSNIQGDPPVPEERLPSPVYQVGQMHNQYSGSQGFALSLAPPSQLLANSNTLLYSQGLQQQTSNFNLRQGCADLGEKQWTQLTSPSSFQSLHSLGDLPPRDRWNNLNTSNHTDMSSFLNAHQSCATAGTSSPQFTRNQLQMQFVSNAPVSYSPFQATQMAGGYPPHNLASSQDISQKISTNPYYQQFSAFGALQTSQHPFMIGTPQQGGLSLKPQGSWSSTPAQKHLSSRESYKVAPSSNTMETTLVTPKKLNNEDFQIVAYKSLESGACAVNSQGSDHGEEHSGQEGVCTAISSMIPNVLHMGERNISDANALVSGSPLTHPDQQGLNRVHRGDDNSPAVSDRNLESFNHVLKPSHGFSQNYSLLHQVLLKNMETDQGRQIQNVKQLTEGHQVTREYNSMAQLCEDDGLNSSSHSTLQTGNTKMLSSLTESSENIKVKAWSSGAAATLVPTEPFSADHVLLSDVINKNIATLTSKKRKISVAEDDWAKSTNCLPEKVEDETETIENVRPSLRSKRRLIMTTTLIQQLLCPAPAAFLSANAALHRYSVAYIVAKLSQGDACSLAHNRRNYPCVPLVNSNVILEKRKDPEGIDDHCFSKAVGNFMNRLKNLHNDFLRLDKATSILDVRLECEELEKVSVINRFAKFHLRPADASGAAAVSGTATSSRKTRPERYITPQPVPRHVPDGAQCLSL